MQLTPDRHREEGRFVSGLERWAIEGAILRVEGCAYQRGGALADVTLTFEAATYTDRVHAVHGLPWPDVAAAFDSDAASAGYTGAGLVVVEPGALYLDLCSTRGERDRTLLGAFHPDAANGAPQWVPARVAGPIGRDGVGQAPWRVDFAVEDLAENRRAARALRRFGAAPQEVCTHRPVSIFAVIGPGACDLTAFFDGLRDTNGYDEIILVDADDTNAARARRIAIEAARIPRCRLIGPAAHSGSVRGYSAAFAARAFRGHVVVVDSEVVLPPGWLPRLIWPLDALPHVASATPFTNTARGALPSPVFDGVALHGMDAATIDRAFQAIDPRRMIVPLASGSGFCMAMHADAIAAVGWLHGGIFAFGPGEEADWCQRAHAMGWRALLVPNLYVQRSHDGSATGAAKCDLLRHNLAIVGRRHPGFALAMSDDRRTDPTAGVRAIISFKLAQQASGRPARMLTLRAGTPLRRVMADLARGDPLLVALFGDDGQTWSALLAAGGHRDQVWGSGAAEMARLRAVAGVENDEARSEFVGTRALV